jgi:hypothetical protein
LAKQTIKSDQLSILRGLPLVQGSSRTSMVSVQFDTTLLMLASQRSLLQGRGLSSAPRQCMALWQVLQVRFEKRRV